jgi:hypothetical protein
VNPWQALLGPVALPPAAITPDEKDRNMAKRRELRTAAGGRVHLMGDEPQQPLARAEVLARIHSAAGAAPTAPRPPNPAPALANASIPEARSTTAPVPRKAAPPVAPSPAAYRVPAPPPKVPMTYADAIAIRERARNKQPVSRALLLEANILVQEARRHAMLPPGAYE